MNHSFKINLQTTAVLVSSLFIFSCSQHQEKHATSSPTVSFTASDSLPPIANPNTNEVWADTASKLETFASFFSLFTKKRDFQNSRIVFPFKCRIEDEDTAYVEEIQRKDWKFITFKPGTNGNTGNGQYTTDTARVNKTEYEVRLRGIDNGIYVVYTFNQKDGKWYLVKMLNGSI